MATARLFPRRGFIFLLAALLPGLAMACAAAGQPPEPAAPSAVAGQRAPAVAPATELQPTLAVAVPVQQEPVPTAETTGPTSAQPAEPAPGAAADPNPTTAPMAKNLQPATAEPPAAKATLAPAGLTQTAPATAIPSPGPTPTAAPTPAEPPTTAPGPEPLLEVGHQVGHRIADFSMELVGGAMVTPAGLAEQGRPAFLFFFATT